LISSGIEGNNTILVEIHPTGMFPRCGCLMYGNNITAFREKWVFRT